MIDLTNIKKLLPPGITLDTLKKVAKVLQKDPNLKKKFQQEVENLGLEKTVDNAYANLKDVFNHIDSNNDKPE